jgi:transcription antitermination protein NusB
MKNAADPRHIQRQKVVEDLFKITFHKQQVGDKARQILENKEKIDKYIKEVAPQFPPDKINKVDLSILRLAIYEIEFEKKEPPKVIVDEAIELAKEYGGETSPAFVNGALGKLVKNATTTV